jgi:hypothetical protein
MITPKWRQGAGVRADVGANYRHFSELLLYHRQWGNFIPQGLKPAYFGAVVRHD